MEHKDFFIFLNVNCTLSMIALCMLSHFKLYSPPWHIPASQVMLVVKNLPTNTGEVRYAGSIPGSKRSLGEEHGNPLQCSCLENHMDRGAWRAPVHGLAQSQT